MKKDYKSPTVGRNKEEDFFEWKESHQEEVKNLGLYHMWL